MLRDKRIDLTVCIFEGSKDKTISFVRHFLSKVLGKLKSFNFLAVNLQSIQSF